MFYGKNDVRIEDVNDAGEPDPNEVQMRVAYCGICGSDLEAIRTGNYVPGVIIGHEFSGLITKIGSEIRDLQVGTEAVASSIVPCGHCSFCLTGRPELCENPLMIGISKNGGMSELVNVPALSVLRIPSNMNLKIAALAEPLSIALHAVNLAHIKMGETILIQGAGPIGLLIEVSLSFCGLSNIIISDISQSRLALAKNLNENVTVVNPKERNINFVVEEITEGSGVDFVFDTTGSGEVFDSDISVTKRGGKIIMVGIPEKPSNASLLPLVINEISLVGSYEGYNEMQEAIYLLSKHPDVFERVITKIVKLDKSVDDGYLPLLENPVEGKILVAVGGDL